MRFAESAGSRSVLVLSTLSTAALLAAALARPAPAAEQRTPVTPYHGCTMGHRARAVAPPPVQAEDPYVAVMRSQRAALAACMTGHDGLQVRVALDVSPDGRVSDVEVKTVTADVSKIDLHLVKCVQDAVSGLQFPTAPDAKRISTFLNQ